MREQAEELVKRQTESTRYFRGTGKPELAVPLPDIAQVGAIKTEAKAEARQRVSGPMHSHQKPVDTSVHGSEDTPVRPETQEARIGSLSWFAGVWWYVLGWALHRLAGLIFRFGGRSRTVIPVLVASCYCLNLAKVCAVEGGAGEV